MISQNVALWDINIVLWAIYLFIVTRTFHLWKITHLTFNWHIHVNPPESSGSLPEMQPYSRTHRSETELPRCKNTKKKKKMFIPDHHFCAYVS